MADPIDRQAALNVITRFYPGSIALDAIQNLPSAERRGKWIKPEGMMPPEFHGHYECLCCNGWAMRDWYHPGKVVLTQYCPHCGARMESKE